MPDSVNISVNDSDYTKRINNMIEANNRLKATYTGLSSSMYSVNKNIDALSNKTSKKSGTVSKAIKDEYSEALKEAEKYIKSASNVAGNFLNTLTGAKLAGGQLGKIVSDSMKALNSSKLDLKGLDISSILKSKKELKDLYNEKNRLQSSIGDTGEGENYEKYVATAIKYREKESEVNTKVAKLTESVGKANVGVLLKSIGIISALTAVTAGFYKAGQSGYAQSMQMSRSLTQLGDSAKYAMGYAKDLNSTLGTNLDKTLNSLAQVVTQLNAIGFSTEQASTVAVNASDLSEKLARIYGEIPADVNEKIVSSITSGTNDLMGYGVNTSDEVMAAWIANTKGINMYATQISDAQMAAYRYEKTMLDLSDVVNYNGNIADNTWSKYLESMEKIESIGLRLKKMLIPVFSEIVDWIDKAVTGFNKFLIALGLTDELVTDESDLAERSADYTSTVSDANVKLKKQGELLKANAQAAGKFPFDKWNQLDSIKQLDTADTLDFGAIKPNIDNEEVKKAAEDAADTAKEELSNADIEKALAGDLSEATEMWKKLLKTDLLSAIQYADDFANKFLNAGDYANFFDAELLDILGDITGINAILDIMDGNIKDGVAEAAQAVLFWFGNWKGKLVAVLGSIAELDLGIFSLGGPMSAVFGLIGGWQGGLGIVSNLLKQIADGDIAEGVNGALAGVLIMLARNKEAVALLSKAFGKSHLGVAGIAVALGSVLSGIYTNINGTQQWYDKLVQVLMIIGSIVTAIGIITANPIAIAGGIGLTGGSFLAGTLINAGAGTGAKTEQAESGVSNAAKQTNAYSYVSPNVPSTTSNNGINSMWDTSGNYSTGLNYSSMPTTGVTSSSDLSSISKNVDKMANTEETKESATTQVSIPININNPNIFDSNYSKKQFVSDIADEMAIALRERGLLNSGASV